MLILLKGWVIGKLLLVFWFFCQSKAILNIKYKLKSIVLLVTLPPCHTSLLIVYCNRAKVGQPGKTKNITVNIYVPRFLPCPPYISFPCCLTSVLLSIVKIIKRCFLCQWQNHMSFRISPDRTAIANEGTELWWPYTHKSNTCQFWLFLTHLIVCGTE